MDYREFYTELGKLLYAVADADGIIRAGEREYLDELIQTRMAHREIHTDEYGTNDAWYARFEFDVAEEQALDPVLAFQSFIEYLDNRKKELTRDTLELCLLLADRLAEACHHTNRPENIMIQQLREKIFSLEAAMKNPQNFPEMA
jgi:hypothetical protein